MDTALVAAHIGTAVVTGTVPVFEVDTDTVAHLLDTFLAVYTPPGKVDMVVVAVALVVDNRAAVVVGSQDLWR